MKTHKKTWLDLFILSTLIILALACGGGGGESGGGIGGTGLQKATTLPYYSANILTGYDQQSELETDLESAANLIAYEIIEGQISSYQITDTIDATPDDQIISAVDFSQEFNDVEIDFATADSAGESSGQTSNNSDFETNVEVESIDEGDSSKSNGNLLFFAKHKELIAMDLSGNVTDRVFFDSNLLSDLASSETETVQSILLNNDELYCLSWKGSDDYTSRITYGSTRLSKFTFTDSGELSYVESKLYPGYYKAFRKSDSNLFLIVNVTINNYHHFRELYRGFYSVTSNNDFSEQASSNIQALATSWKDKVISEIFTAYNRTLDNDTLSRVLKVHQNLSGEESEDDASLNASKGLGTINSYLQISVIDLEQGLDSEKLSGEFTSNSYRNFVYVDGEQLALGGYGLNRDSDSSFIDATFVTSYDIENGVAQAVATGTVPGYVPETFGVRHRNDHYEFISSMPGRFTFENGSWQQTQNRESFVSTYNIQGNTLTQVGLLSGLGNNENLMSSRFVDDRAYVVTFRTIDPFYVIDLSDVNNPSVLGELEIPGFSSYLHPISSNTILGIGREDQNLLLNLFDVSDPTVPNTIHRTTVAGYSSSGLTSDHKAFRYLSSSNTLVLPVSSFVFENSSYSHEDGFRLYQIDESAGFTLTGNISHHSEVSGEEDYLCYTPGFLSPRSFFYSPNQFVTVKGHHVLSSASDNLQTQWNVDLTKNSLDTTDYCNDWFGIIQPFSEAAD